MTASRQKRARAPACPDDRFLIHKQTMRTARWNGRSRPSSAVLGFTAEDPLQPGNLWLWEPASAKPESGPLSARLCGGGVCGQPLQVAQRREQDVGVAVRRRVIECFAVEGGA